MNTIQGRSENSPLRKPFREESQILGGIYTSIRTPLAEKAGKLPVIYLDPGLWCTSEHYIVQNMTEILTDMGFAVVTLDHIGLGDLSIGGKTSGPSSSYHIDQMIEDNKVVLEGLKEHKNLDSDNIMGLGISMGAISLLDMMKFPQDPSNIKRLLLLSPFINISAIWDHYSKLITSNESRMHHITSEGKRKLVDFNVFYQSEIQGHYGLSRDILNGINIPVSIIFGEKDEYFDVLEASQNAPYFSLELMKEIQDVKYDVNGIAKRPIITLNSLVNAAEGKRKTEQLGNLYIVQNANHNLNNTPEVKTALRSILQDELS